MNIPLMLLYVLIMATVTFLIRAVPFTLFRKKIKSTFLLSFFYYIPYAVLSAMTFPFIFFSTNGNVILGLIGTIVALIVALFKRSLITVAVISTVAVLISEYIILLF